MVGSAGARRRRFARPARSRFRPVASDLAGHLNYGGGHTIWVDRTAPRAAFSGELWDVRGSWLREPPGHQLRIAGTDNTVAGESGIARYVVQHSHQPDTGAPTSAPATIDDYDPCPNPQPQAAPPADWQPCPSAGAMRTLSGLALPEGRHRFDGAVTDHAGNGGQPAGFDVYVDATRPDLQLTGSLADLDGTWGAPEGVLYFTPDASDALSGLDSIVAEVSHEGRTIANLTERRPCPSPELSSLAPCPRTPQAVQLSVPADDLAEGTVEVSVSARDYAGNSRRRTLELHVDRTPPEVALEGDILDMDRGWQDPDAPVTAVVSAADNLSGISAVELWVRDANGREQLLAREQVCDESTDYTGDGAPCPLDVMVPFDVDPTRLPDGRNTFFARATEFAGKRARDDMTVDIDNTAPNAPTNLQIAERGEDGATLSWTPGPEPAADAGIAHYVITVVVDGVVVTENISPHPYATIGGLPPGLSVRFLIKAVDRLDRRSSESSGGIARIARFMDAGSAGFSDTRAAYKLRPLILLDTKEDWRPRNIHDFFKERDGDGGAAHRVCHHRRVIGDDCDDVNKPDDLYKHRESDDYLDIRGHKGDGSDAIDPDLGRCKTPSRKDCGSGPGSAIYFNATRTKLHLYMDYWWFFRYNDAQRGPDGLQCKPVLPCFDHEGDWEGITVVTSPTSSDRIQYVSFSSHGHWYKFPVGVTQLSGKRTRVYVARGTHANYPRPCSDGCKQTDTSEDGIYWVPETQYDGRVPWERNSEEVCAGNCVLPMPERDRDVDALPRGNAASFANWPGRWGKKEKKLTDNLAQGPESPGRQPHYSDPGHFIPTNRRRFSAVSRLASAAPPEVANELAAESDCEGWRGPMVAVAARDSSAIADALATNTMDQPGDVTITGDPDDVTGSAPGISQLLSAPLQPGDEIRVTGRAEPDTAVTVRTATKSGVREWQFIDPGLARGGSATVTVDAAAGTAGPLLVRPDGTAVRATPAAGAATASTAPRRLRLSRRRGKVVATFVAGGTRTRIEQRRLRAGLATSSRTVRTRSGRRARVRLRLRTGTRYVAIRTMGKRNSSPVVRRVPRAGR